MIESLIKVLVWFPTDIYIRAFLYLSYMCSTYYSNQYIDLLLVIEQNLPYFTKPD